MAASWCPVKLNCIPIGVKLVPVCLSGYGCIWIASHPRPGSCASGEGLPLLLARSWSLLGFVCPASINPSGYMRVPVSLLRRDSPRRRHIIRVSFVEVRDAFVELRWGSHVVWLVQDNLKTSAGDTSSGSGSYISESYALPLFVKATLDAAYGFYETALDMCRILSVPARAANADFLLRISMPSSLPIYFLQRDLAPRVPNGLVRNLEKPESYSLCDTGKVRGSTESPPSC